MFHRCDIGCLIVAVTARCILRNNLLNRGPSPCVDIEIADEPEPVRKAIGPTLHLRVATPTLINTGSISDATFVAWRARHPRLSRGAKIRLVPEEGQGIHRVNPIVDTLVSDHGPQSHSRRMIR